MKLIPLLIFFTSFSASAEKFQSTTHQTSLLELYSSQGCSSCPPAERWISNLSNHKSLWIDFVPIVFHVDYWNQLGWHDPFSKPAFSQRQRTYHQQGSIRSVYTPGFILNGSEWRTWFLRKSIPTESNPSQVLSASFMNNQLDVKYESYKQLILNVAILGFDIKTDVLTGENKDRSFTENFIVLSHQTSLSKNGKWSEKLSRPKHADAKKYALAIWVSEPDNLKPLQSVGGWVKL